MSMIVVSGAPGTGKSTVASALAVGLGWPEVGLDAVKETLADVLGLGDEDWSGRLGDAAAEVLFRLCPRFPQVVVEGWWRGERRRRAIEEFAGAMEVFCRCEPDLAIGRMRDRMSGGHPGGRHPIHRDMINPSILAGVAASVASAAPLGLGAELILVDTGEPGAAGAAVAEARAAVSRALAGPAGRTGRR